MMNSIKILPFAFALHNFEEAWAICKAGKFEHNPFVVSSNQFIIAVALFTVLGFVLVFGKKLYRNQQYYQFSTTGFAGMLFLNAFFPHILATIYFRAYMPGFITALLLILPLTGSILWKTFQSKAFSTKQFITVILSGGIAGIALLAVFLTLGYVF
ncbi:MAG: HXXEE domain-containing protein [Tannerellaceae bacterium]|jgi:hypothetical protein|nr:HXXEE domain-containing protein [Tannerellaceae bacterium]